MKVSLNWLKHFTEVDLATKDLVQLASERLGGVEGFEDFGKKYDQVLVVRVVSVVDHPNADKLHLCKIDDGGISNVQRDSDGNIQVVCGAPNVRSGLLVAWIPPKATVPSTYNTKEPFVIDARELRGLMSNGMLASAKELDLGDDHSGILEIHEMETEAKPGTEFKTLFGLDDVVIEVENKMFTHRPDCFGQLGLAREIAGIQHKKFSSPAWYKSAPKSDSNPDNQQLSVAVDIPELCPRYAAVVIDNVEVKPSPLWLQALLKRVGIRSINNVVDVTNFMMMLTAQPLHAFDFNKIAIDGKAQIIVRKPNDGEKMSLLDGREIQPHKEAILICNPSGPIALGGIMGGGNSEVDASTTKIVLEAANFDMYNIRKTSMIHGIFTDAVTRFNKGQTAAQIPAVLEKAVEMFQKLAGGEVVGTEVDVDNSTTKNPTISINLEFINSRLGSDLVQQEVVDLLENVEFRIENDQGELQITAPFWRTDIEIAEDIVEEVGRLYGFNNLSLDLPTRQIQPAPINSLIELKKQIRSVLCRAGANEVLTYSFIHGNLLTKVGQKPQDSYKLRNALSPDLQYYRQSLTPSLLEKIHGNIKAGFDEFALFEINKTHNKTNSQTEDGLPGEMQELAFSYANKKSIGVSSYFQAKRFLDYLAHSFGIKLRYQTIDTPLDSPVAAPFDQSRSARVSVDQSEEFLGIIGEYRAEVAKNLKLPSQCAGFEIDLDVLNQALSQDLTKSYKTLDKFPSISQDITFQVDDKTKFAELESAVTDFLYNTGLNYSLKTVSIFRKDDDLNKNITFHIVLSDKNKTLQTEEVNKLLSDLSEDLSKQNIAKRI
jgi:phenylalanyl-tRNA synthetase beta chain